MATLFVHAALPLVARGAFTPLPRLGSGRDEGRSLERRLLTVAVICACLPDLDIITFMFEVRATDHFGHDGFFHSLFFAAILSILAAILFFRSLKIGSRQWLGALAFIFGATAAHGIVDAATNAEVGVALFAPFDWGRVFLPIKILPSSQSGVNEYFGFWGLLAIANELLYVIMPVALVVSLVRARKNSPAQWLTPTTKKIARMTVGWISILFFGRLLAPEYFCATTPRVLRANGDESVGIPNDIPHDDLPGKRLVTRFDDLRALGLFEKDLEPSHPIWSSSFFPAWFGEEAGRWTDGKPRLVWRTLFGFAPPQESEARAWLAAASANDAAAQKRLFTLAPVEKVDIALGRLQFPAQAHALERSHNGHPRYWSGLCNGVGAAAIAEVEPFRVVDVIGVDGSHIAFHPNDIKALLAVAFYKTQEMSYVGQSCGEIGFDAAKDCSMDPSVFVMALLNRIGLMHDSFLVDALPTVAIQFYPVARARVHVVHEPHEVGKIPVDPKLVGRVTSLVDVDLDLTMSSTTLRYDRANVIDPSSADGSRYEHVGLVPVSFTYHATIALDASSEMIGGRWTGDPADGPDAIVFVSGGPLLENGNLSIADTIPWSFVRELARASADDGAARPTLDLRTHCDGRCP